MSAAARAPYIHANALVLGDKGVLLRGPSGSGKSALTLALISRYQSQGEFARLVGDDRVRVEALNGRLIARPHPAIAGMIEIRGHGLSRVETEAACVLRAIVDIRTPDDPPSRLPDAAEKSASLHAIALPRLCTEGCSDVSVARIIFFIQSIATI
ncbi:HPr kinase/phosphatase C-terminal domain-containing protein [Methylocystis sp. MJC1]|jgi:serine kinase of HPr protein (carbohydrate metabolism regulator)|nr:HPr kinase/phosphatase C-terminal domain-containing protein [Methylocystis sp. MJC1]KAF2988822.1 HPr kinase/phosphorylase [Methylocystis sp. MJC1]MBU6528584.1 HPr kinase/phosphatase C-terminal domain-containing protein [Methylocystis sp. MJC1]UZX11477.1 HPr kinase/phosphatase C-terminal domain-containing protein [Methylocystis sp. MJC1]